MPLEKSSLATNVLAMPNEGKIVIQCPFDVDVEYTCVFEHVVHFSDSGGINEHSWNDFLTKHRECFILRDSMLFKGLSLVNMLNYHPFQTICFLIIHKLSQ